MHKLGIHMRAVVILDEDDSDDDMMRFKNNDTPFWSSLISLVHVLSYISVETPTVNPPLGHLSAVLPRLFHVFTVRPPFYHVSGTSLPPAATTAHIRTLAAVPATTTCLVPGTATTSLAPAPFGLVPRPFLLITTF